jgi:pimeloyl-ACP methyl ester carboxylesterase
MSHHPSAFKTSEGEAAYRTAYNDALMSWPVPYEEIDVPSRFGTTHVIVSGPRHASPLVLLHGYWATATMWIPNVADFSKAYRVYAVDVMGQPGKSVPDEPIRNAADYMAWLTATLDGLHLDRVSLAGMSYGGWLSLSYALAAPDRVEKLVLLSPAASVLPLVTQFGLRGTLMFLWPRRFMVSRFMRWLGFEDSRGTTAAPGLDVIGLMHLGLRHFRPPQETLRIAPTVFSDGELQALRVPTLLLLGDREVIYDPARAMARARRLIPNIEGALLPGTSHDMTSSQCRAVDARVLDFLTDKRHNLSQRVVA